MMKNYCLLLLMLFGLGFKAHAQYPGCPGVIMDPTGVGLTNNLDGSISVCEVGTEVTFTATYLKTGGTETYAVAPIPYNPPFPFTTGTATSLAGDDDWSEVIDLGFDFCFFNKTYNKALATDNGAITFSVQGFGGVYTPLGGAGFTFNQQIPFTPAGTGPPYKAAIFGVLQDTNASPSASGPGAQISYEIVGTYPCRTLVFNIFEIGQFSCNTGVGTQTSQVVLYEGTNIIDVYVEKRTPCLNHNGGNGLIGVQNEDGTIGIAPPGRNTGTWTAMNEAWRFTPNGAPNYVLEWYQDGVLLPTTTDNLTLVPTGPTEIVARVTYMQCNGVEIVSEQSQTILFDDPPVLGNPRILKQCVDINGSTTFDLTQINNDITTDPSFVFEYYATELDIQNDVPMGATYTTSNTQSVQNFWVVLTNTITGCTFKKQFSVKAESCTLFLQPLADLTVCREANATPTFNLKQYDTVVFNGALGYTVQYFTSEADALANNSAAAISDLNASNYVGFSGETIWVRVTNDNDSQYFAVTSFRLYIYEKPEVVNLTPLATCEIGTSGLGEFNLASAAAEATTNLTNLSASFYPTVQDAETANPAFLIPQNYTGEPGTIFVRVENSITGCYSIMPLQLQLINKPNVTQIAPLEYCDANNDGYGTFNLEPTKFAIAGNPLPANVEVTFHETQADADFNVNAIPNINTYNNTVVNQQTIYVRISVNNSSCYSVVPLVLKVNGTPKVANPTSLKVCDINNDNVETFNLRSKEVEILNGLNAADYTFTYHLNQPQAISGSNAIGNPTNFVNTTSPVVYVRVTNNVTGCYAIVRLDLIPVAMPVVQNPLPTYYKCDTDGNGFETFDLASLLPSIVGNQQGLEVSFHYTNADAQAGTSDLPLSYQNGVVNVQTVFVRVFNPTTGCYVVTLLDLRVKPNPVIQVPAEPYVICTSAGAGFGTINLNTYGQELVQATGQNYDFGFFETQSNAQNNIQEIATPEAYNNLQGTNASVWIRITDLASGCFSVYQIHFQIVVPPVIPASLPEIKLCDTLGDLQDGITMFDLTVQNAAMLAVQTVPGTYQIRYFTTEELAEANTNWIANPAQFQNTANPQTIWVRIDDLDKPGDCNRIMSFTIKVELPMIINQPAPIVLCDTGLPNDGSRVFDLTIREQQIVPAQIVGTVVTYHLNEQDARNGWNAIQNPTQFTNTVNPQTIYVSVLNEAGCRSITTLTLRVLPLPEPNVTPEALEACEDVQGSGFAMFNLADAEANLSNFGNYTYSYFITQNEAENNVGAIATPEAYFSSSSTIYVRVTNVLTNEAEQCSVVVALNLVVNPLPVVGPMTPYPLCLENPPADGRSLFDLHTKDSEALAGANAADYIVRYYRTQADADANTNALPYNYINETPFVETVFVRVENIATGCFTVATFTLHVEQKVYAFPAQETTFCETDYDNDGVSTVDLTVMDASIIGTQPVTGLAVRYYRADGVTAINPSNAAQINHGEVLVAEVYNTDPNFKCVARIEVTVYLKDAPVVAPLVDGIICYEYRESGTIITGHILDTKINDPANYTFEWFRNNTPIVDGVDADILDSGARIYAKLAGTYSVRVTSTINGCSTTRSAVVQLAPAITIDEIIMTDSFGDTNAIEVIAISNQSPLEYKLDEGPWQDSNIFLDVLAGEHTVYVRVKGALSCPASKVITVMDFPKYFTPNNDGYHDTWNIWALKNQPKAKIYIFDRYGKLIKQLSPAGSGWDGTFNGKDLPSTDYWFKAEYIDPKTGLQKEVTGHFSLKR